MAGSPVLAEPGDQKQATAALVEGVGAAQVGRGGTAVGDLADEGAVADQAELAFRRRFRSPP